MNDCLLYKSYYNILYCVGSGDSEKKVSGGCEFCGSQPQPRESRCGLTYPTGPALGGPATYRFLQNTCSGTLYAYV